MGWGEEEDQTTTAANEAATSAADKRAIGRIDGVGRKSARTSPARSTATTVDHRAERIAVSLSLKNLRKVLPTLTLPNETVFDPTTPSRRACSLKASSKSDALRRTASDKRAEDKTTEANEATDLIQGFMFIVFLNRRETTMVSRPQIVPYPKQLTTLFFNYLRLALSLSLMSPWPLALESISEYWTGHEQLGPKKISAKHHQVY